MNKLKSGWANHIKLTCSTRLTEDTTKYSKYAKIMCKNITTPKNHVFPDFFSQIFLREFAFIRVWSPL